VDRPATRIRPIGDDDRAEVARVLRERWGADIVVAHDRVFEPATLDGYLAEAGPEWLGLLTFDVTGNVLEIVTIDAFAPGGGVGTALLDAAADAARRHGCARVRLTTTNDNLDALRFYQRRGFHLVELRPGAVDRARRTKPQIPELGAYGIPLRDELALERETGWVLADDDQVGRHRRAVLDAGDADLHTGLDRARVGLGLVLEDP